MEEMKKNFLSLPPNYVSLKQLQERRLREQEQKQKENEEEEEQRRLKEQKLREEEEKENERRIKEEEEKKIRKPRKNQEQIGAKTSSIRHNRKNCWRKSDRKKEKEDSKSKNQESEIAVAVAVVEQENPEVKQKVEETKQKPKRKRYGKKKGKSKEWKTEETENGDLKEVPAPEDDRQAKTQTITSSETTTVSNQTDEIVRRVAMLSVVDDAHKADEKEGERSTVVVNTRLRSTRRRPPSKQTAEIAPRIENPTACDDPKTRVNQNGRKAMMNGTGRWDHRISGRFGYRRDNGRDNANLVWVRKGE